MLGRSILKQIRHRKKKLKSRATGKKKQFPKAGLQDFPFPLGTPVAVDFTNGIYAGKITELYPGEDLCTVTFTDNDFADYDAGQVKYAVDLYEQEFPVKE